MISCINCSEVNCGWGMVLASPKNAIQIPAETSRLWNTMMYCQTKRAVQPNNRSVPEKKSYPMGGHIFKLERTQCKTSTFNTTFSDWCLRLASCVVLFRVSIKAVTASETNIGTYSLSTNSWPVAISNCSAVCRSVSVLSMPCQTSEIHQ